MDKKGKVKQILFDIFIKYQGILLVLIALDQITKLLAVKYLATPIKIFGWDWLQLKQVYNPGIAFSMFDDAPAWTKAMISLVAVIAIEAFIIIKKPKDKVMTTMLILIVAGALGNGIDRILTCFPATGYKGVVDFIYVDWFANFNVADIYVTLTCIAMIIYLLFFEEKRSQKIKQEEVMKEKSESHE